MSLPPEQRRSTSAVRIISLTPPGVSTNEVLHYIVQDLVTASVNGIEGYTPSGASIKIFLDVVGFIGDYPASSETIDTIGHVGRAPCTLYTFKRTQEVDSTGTKFGYTTKAHANNSTFLRQAERHHSLRASILRDEDANRLGMVQNWRVSEHRAPLLHLQSTLQLKRNNSADNRRVACYSGLVRSIPE